MARLRTGFPLADHPFAQVGAPLGLAEDEVLERLGRLLAHGRLARVGPVYVAERTGTLDPLDSQLVAVTAGGLPLVPEPYEAVGALVGLSAREVQDRLGDMLARGFIRRIGTALP